VASGPVIYFTVQNDDLSDVEAWYPLLFFAATMALTLRIEGNKASTPFFLQVLCEIAYEYVRGLVLLGAFLIAATFAVAYVLLPFIPGFVRMYNGGNFGTTTHLGSFVVSCAFVVHYFGIVSASILLPSVFRRFSEITDDVQHLGNMQIHNLKELHQWQMEVTALKKTHAVAWANFERMCACLSLGVVVCDAYLYSRGFRAGQSLNDSSYLDGNFLTLYAVSIMPKAALVAAGADATDLHEKYIQSTTSKLRSKQMDELAHQSELGSMNQNSQDDLANYIDHVIHFL
jgi:hypothetical protein